MTGVYRSYFVKPISGTDGCWIRWAITAEDIHTLVVSGYQRVPYDVAKNICIATRKRRKRENASNGAVACCENASNAGSASCENAGDAYVYPFGWDTRRRPSRIFNTYIVLN